MKFLKKFRRTVTAVEPCPCGATSKVLDLHGVVRCGACSRQIGNHIARMETK